MKLLFCKDCGSVFSLSYEEKKCDCGKTSGKYQIDGLHAEYSGQGIPIGFANNSFGFALKHQPKQGLGQEFQAFVIPEICSTFENK